MKTVFFFCTGIVGLAMIWLLSTSGEYHRTYSSDRQYSVYAKKYNWERILSRNPGGGGDASGKVFLYDEVEQKVIQEAEISMISNVGSIEWREDRAFYVGEAYPNISKPWQLPRPIKRY